MNGIYYKNGVYVLIENNTENDSCIYHHEYKCDVTLYGGRVTIGGTFSGLDADFKIDGISIVKMKGIIIDKDLSLSTIVSHLNAIETNGVDAFLVNYKKSVEFLYNELKELNQKTESQLTLVQEDSKMKTLMFELSKIRDVLFSVLAILFSLYMYMPAGLENEKVISVCQSVMDSLA